MWCFVRARRESFGVGRFVLPSSTLTVGWVVLRGFFEGGVTRGFGGFVIGL